MALHLNLYHEIERDKQARARDPLKLGMIGLGGIAALFAAYYIQQMLTMHGITVEYNTAKAEFDRIDKKSVEAQKKIDDLALEMKTSDAFQKRVEGRFYWAPIMDQINSLVTRDIQVTRIAGDVQGEGPRRCNISVEGVSAGPDPRKTAEGLRKSLEDALEKKYKAVATSFRSLEDGAAPVMLDGVSQPTAVFNITVHMTMGEEAPKAPPRRGKQP